MLLFVCLVFYKIIILKWLFSSTLSEVPFFCEFFVGLDNEKRREGKKEERR